MRCGTAPSGRRLRRRRTRARSTTSSSSAPASAGSTAAHFFRAARPDARVLILDNHDDFGGHAKRNEFTHNGRTYIGYGGTQSIDSPAPYSPVAKGADQRPRHRRRAATRRRSTAGLYKSLGLRSGDVLRQGNVRRRQARRRRLARRRRSWRRRRSARPSKRDLKRLATEKFDPMPGLSSAEKKARLARMSYADFLTKLWKLDPGVLWALSDAHARPLRRRHRRRSRAGCLRPRPSRIRRHGPRCRARARPELRRDSQRRGGGLLLPFPRRQRVGGATAGATPGPERDSGIDGGRSWSRRAPTTRSWTKPAPRSAFV